MLKGQTGLLRQPLVRDEFFESSAEQIVDISLDFHARRFPSGGGKIGIFVREDAREKRA